MQRLNPDQIKLGRSYRLMPYHLVKVIPNVDVIRRVDEIRDGNVLVHVNGKEVCIPVRDFARMAVEEVEG